VRRRQRRGAKPLGQCISSIRTATVFVRIGCDRQHQGGRELGSNGMVNLSESLIIVVNTNKPKVLIGLSQNGKWSSVEAAKSSTADVVPPAKKARPNPFSATHSERGKPIVLPLGKRAARQADRAAGKGGWKKRTPSCNEMDRG
jgi:hypothetical protein